MRLSYDLVPQRQQAEGVQTNCGRATDDSNRTTPLRSSQEGEEEEEVEEDKHLSRQSVTEETWLAGARSTTGGGKDAAAPEGAAAAAAEEAVPNQREGGHLSVDDGGGGGTGSAETAHGVENAGKEDGEALAQVRAVNDDVNKFMTAGSTELRREQERRTGGQGNGDGGGRDGTSVWASRGILVLVAMIYGTNFGCISLLEESVPSSLAAALRFSVAVIPFIPFLKVTPAAFVAGVEIGTLSGIAWWAQSMSLETTTASKSAFICSLAVIIVPILDALFGEKDARDVAREQVPDEAGGIFAWATGPLVPALVAVAGVACLELAGVEGGPNLGDVWAMMQPLCFGLAFWRTERHLKMYPDETIGLVAVLLLTVAVLAVGWCIQAGGFPQSLDSFRETVLPSSGSLAVPISLLWTGLVTTSLTVFGEVSAMKKVSAAESTIILTTEPIWAAAFAACLLGERIGWNTGLGALLIVFACTWSPLLSLMASRGGTGNAPNSDLLDAADMGIDVERGMVLQ